MANIPEARFVTRDLFERDGTVLSVSKKEFKGVQKTTKDGIPVYSVLTMIHQLAVPVSVPFKGEPNVEAGQIVQFENLRVGRWAQNAREGARKFDGSPAEPLGGFYYEADAVIVRNYL